MQVKLLSPLSDLFSLYADLGFSCNPHCGSYSFWRSSRGASGFDEVRFALRETFNRKAYIGKLEA